MTYTKPYSLWDHEECGGYGHFETRELALAAFGKIVGTSEGRSFHGPIPFMFLVKNGSPVEKIVPEYQS